MQNFLFNIIKDLSQRHIDFVVCGGVACILQGCERTTLDIIDIFLTYPIEYSELKKNSDLFDIGGIKFHVSSKSDLIKAKRLVDPIRNKDLEDIKSLETLLEQKEN